MARRFLLILGIILCGQLATAAYAEKRVALLIGNSHYTHVPELANPANDIARVADVLRKAGFDVVTGTDLTRLQFEDTTRRFMRAAAGADIGLFYYSGHGIQVADQNFLVPVDAVLKHAEDLELEAYSLDTIVKGLQARAKAQLVFLDACRNFPLDTTNYYVGATLQPAGATRGLARLSAAVGSLLVYATAPNSLAQDGKAGGGSPFSDAFANRVLEPNREVRQIVSDIRRDVIAATSGQQVPWESSSLTQDLFLVQRIAKPVIEPLVQVSAPAGVGVVNLAPPPPRHPDGAAMTIKIDAVPVGGTLNSGGRALKAGDALSPAEFAALRYERAPGGAKAVDVVAYTVADDAGNEAHGSIAIVTAEAASQPPPAATTAVAKRAAALAAAWQERAMPAAIGVGPLALDLVAAPAPEDASLTAVVTAVPEKGLVALDDHVVSVGANLSIEEMGRLAFQPQVGSENRDYVLAVDFQAAGRVVSSGKATLSPLLDDCDSLAGEPLDLQGVAPGRLPNEIDGAKAVAACRKAIADYPGVARFQYQLARALFASRDLAGGQVALRLANALGHVRAGYEMGYLAQTGFGEQRDDARAIDLFKTAAMKGDPFALYSYGKALYHGRGVAPDQGTGLIMMGRAAELGHTYAMNELGAIYLGGKGLGAADTSRGLRYYEAGAQRNDIYSIDNLAIAYANGQGVPQDVNKALGLFKIAIDGGHPLAPNELGRLYFNGIGVPKDIKEAAKWYRLGADRGDAYAASNLAFILAGGLAGKADPAGASRLYGLAASLGDPAQNADARKALAGLPVPAKRAAIAAMVAELKLKPGKADDATVIDLARRAWEATNPRHDLF